MATKKQTTAKTKSLMRGKNVIDTPESLLRHLHGRHTFGPAFNKRIEDALDRAGATRRLDEITPFKVTRVDPLLDPPQIFGPPHIYRSRLVFTKMDAEDERCVLGYVHGHLARIWHNTQSGLVVFGWGCAREESEESARLHWRNGISNKSFSGRPSADALIRYVKAICEFRGWTW